MLHIILPPEEQNDLKKKKKLHKLLGPRFNSLGELALYSQKRENAWRESEMNFPFCSWV